MNRVERYLQAAERPNTEQSYASAVQHFESTWRGLLPTTGDSVAEYLAAFAGSLSSNTLRQRLAALARWHVSHGFADPTKAPIVSQVLKGIRSVHPAVEKRARPLVLSELESLDFWLLKSVSMAMSENNRALVLRLKRDRAIVLVGFWRGFRSDELVNLQREHVSIEAGQGMTLFLGRSKADRNLEGVEMKCPALSRLCPVTALNDWLEVSGITQGPVFRGISRWGKVSSSKLHEDSLNPILRSLFRDSGLLTPRDYSSHSLRRGFAGWARDSGWDIKELMEYVGWRDIKSALRYLEIPLSGLKARFEGGLSS